MNAAEIKDMWKRNSTDASHRGTWMHLQIEVLLNVGYVAGQWPELTLFAIFLRDLPLPLMAFRTEWCLFSKEHSLAGCIDFVAETADNSLVLFVWKRTKQLRAKYNDPWRCTQAPLGHLPDCAGWHYRLQLNTYKFLLQQYYGRSVSAMYVVCLHPDNADTGPFIDDVPDMTQKVVAMVSTWQELSGGAEPSGGSQCSFDARVAAEVEAGMDMANSDAAAAAIRSADGAALQSQEMVLALSLMNGEETQDVGNEEALALPCSGLPAEAVASAKKDA